MNLIMKDCLKAFVHVVVRNNGIRMLAGGIQTEA
jgi:hypothetical protein